MTFSFHSTQAAALGRDAKAMDHFHDQTRLISGRSGIVSLYAFDYEDDRPRIIGRGRPVILSDILSAIRQRDWDGRPTGFYLVPFQPLPAVAQEIVKDALGFGLKRLSGMSAGSTNKQTLITRFSGLDRVRADHPIISFDSLSFSFEGLSHNGADITYCRWSDVCDLHQEENILILFLNGGRSLSFLPAQLDRRTALDRVDQA